MTTKGWIAWDKEEPEEGAVFVWGHDKDDAIVSACRYLGYDIEDVVRLNTTPQELVEVVRCGQLDGHSDYSLPADVREAAEEVADELLEKAVAKQTAERERFQKMIAAAKAKAGGAL